MSNFIKSSAANSRIAKNSIFMVFRMIFVLGINLYISRIILNTMGVSDYGIYGIVGGFVTMVGFISSTLINGIQRYYNYEIAQAGDYGTNAVFNNAIRMVVLLSLFLAFAGEAVGMWAIINILNIPSERLYAAKLIFHFSLASFIFHLIQIPFTALITAYEKMNIYALISVIQALMTLGAVSLLSNLNVDHLISYGLIVCLISFSIMLVYIIYCKISFKGVYIVKNIDTKLLKKMLTFSGWNIFGAVGNLMRSQGINIILNIFFGTCINAAREIANQVNSGIQTFVQNVIMPISPQIVKSYANGNVKRSINLFFSASKFSCHILTVLSIPVIIEINYILKLWLGNSAPENADIFTILILLGTYANNLAATASSFSYATGKIRNYQINGSTFSTLALVVVVAVLHYFPKPELVFLILLLIDIVKHISGFLIIKKIEASISCKRYLTSVVLPVAATFVLALTTTYLVSTTMVSSFVRLCVVASHSCLIVFLCLATFALSGNEKNMLFQIFRAIKDRIFGSNYVRKCK